MQILNKQSGHKYRTINHHFLGVVVLSWYPPGVADEHGEPTEDLVPSVMDAAHRHSLKVTGERQHFFFLCLPF